MLAVATSAATPNSAVLVVRPVSARRNRERRRGQGCALATGAASPLAGSVASSGAGLMRSVMKKLRAEAGDGGVGRNDSVDILRSEFHQSHCASHALQSAPTLRSNTLVRRFHEGALRDPQQLAFAVFPRGALHPLQGLTWSDWAPESRALAGMFLSTHVRRGERIAIFADSRPLWPIVDTLARFKQLRLVHTLLAQPITVTCDDLEPLRTAIRAQFVTVFGVAEHPLICANGLENLRIDVASTPFVGDIARNVVELRFRHVFNELYQS